MRPDTAHSGPTAQVDPNSPTFALTVKVGYVVCVAFSLLYVVLGDLVGAALIGAACIVLAMGHAIHAFTGRTRPGIELLNAATMVATVVISYRGGGLQSPVTAWLVIPPYVSVSLGYNRSAAAWCVAVAGVLGAFWYTEATLGPLPVFLGRSPSTMRTLATSGLFVVVLVYLYLVERARKRAFLRAEQTARELENRNTELAGARDAALAAAETKSRFLANMSHEIRTPLNGVLGMTELLIDTPLDDSQRSYAETAYRSGRSLLGLLNDILDFSKNEAGRLELEHIEFDLRQVVEDVAELSAAAAKEKALQLSCTVDPEVPRRVAGDPVRLRQVLGNLAGNAVKFTQRGTVAVRVAIDDRVAPPSPPAGADGDKVHLVFEIRDTGIGIAPEALKRLFQPFSQADESTTRRFGGTGLGLAISRQVVEAMNGTIEVESAPEAGSTFRVALTFDWVAQNSPETARERDGGADLRGLRVLVAEDNRVNQVLAGASLSRLGCIGTIVADGYEAVEVARRNDFDVILMDCQMPGIDGFDATRRLRAAGLIHLPIVAVTADVLEGDRERCLAAGMNDYLSKPYSQSELAAVLHRWALHRASGCANERAPA